MGEAAALGKDEMVRDTNSAPFMLWVGGRDSYLLSQQA